jgi:hypothetical protein
MSIDAAETLRLLIVVSTMTILLVSVYWRRNNGAGLRPLPVTTESGANVQQTIADLTATVNTLRRQLDDSDRRIVALENENKVLASRIKELEAKEKQSLPILPPKPLWIIGGGDESIFARDQAALMRARVPFQRTRKATTKSILEEMRRRRLDGTMYLWVILSSHAGPEGIELCDGIAPPDFWREALTGIEVVMLAACSASTTADELAGLVKRVIYFTEDVANQDAADMNYAFWRRMLLGINVDQAYAEAVREVPAVASFVDIRRS